MDAPRSKSPPDSSSRCPSCGGGDGGTPEDPAAGRVALGRKLREARAAAHLTGPEVRARTGIDPGGLSRMESGASIPTIARLRSLAKLYDVPLPDLLAPLESPSEVVEEVLSQHLSVASFIATKDLRFHEVQELEWEDHPELLRRARRFAAEVFEPLRIALGVDLQVKCGFRNPLLDDDVREGQARFRAHSTALAADVVPVAMCLPAAATVIRSAVQRGDLPLLDYATLENSKWLHVEAAPDGERPRQLVVAPVTRCAWFPEVG